ncbi:MAG TPA: L,D-transpeptidase family protein [Pseudolabrys sp.]|nr:L,D-transpeptidase family protein [Pseudolabrys sp.]
MRSSLPRLLAGSALAAVLVVSASQAGHAQETSQGTQNVSAAAGTSPSGEPAMVDGFPVPDTTLPPPPTIDDVRALERPSPPATAQAEPVAPAAATPVAADTAATPAASTPTTTSTTEPAADTAKTTASEAAPKPAATDTATAPAAASPDKPATAAAPAAIDSVDTAIAGRLRDLSSGKYDRILGSKKERAAVEAFYSARDFAPLWTTNGSANAAAKAAIGYLHGVAADALDPSDYPTPDFTAARDADALAEAEMRLTDSVLKFAYHASVGRVHFTRVAADIQYDLKAPDPETVLRQLASAGDVAAALDGFNPQAPAYQKLKAKLAELRAGDNQQAEGPAPIAHGPALKLAGKTPMSDPRVPALRQRLGADGDRSSQAYDEDVADAVRRFQRAHGLHADGVAGRNTIDAINGPRAKRNPTDAIIATMERWRWMPRPLGNPYIMVNVPDYTLHIVKDGKTYWKTKIVAGKPSNATPLISAEMKFITVNPTWNVPPSIIQNEYLPALREDPQALERIGLKVEQAADGTVRIYQPPGDRNALGRIRFNFPNKFLVYQHDTPDKNLFAHAKRAYSHGCMRVQDPLLYGEKLLSLAMPQENYTATRLQKMFGGSEININFPKTIPVHLTYQTAFVDDDGSLQIREDVYGRDARVLAALRGPDRRVADVAVARAPDTSARPVRVAPGSLGGPAGRDYDGPPNFFDWLFGGGQQHNYRGQRRMDNNGRLSYR